MNIVDRQILAYNKKDLAEFLDCYTDDIQVFMLHSNQKLTDGKEKLSSTMSSAFGDQDSNTTVTSRIEQGNLVINKEKISGHVNDKTISTVSIYEITGGKISKLWFGGRTES